MSDTRAFDGEIIIYGTTAGSAAKVNAVRGAGKWIFCLLQAAETLSRGSSVWVKLPPCRSVESLSRELAGVRLLPKGGLEKEYEKKRTEEGDGMMAGPFFGDYTFAATVGLWLERGREPAAALLSPFISTEGFVFTPTEFIDLRERLQRAIRRYERLPGVSRGLEDLNTGFFRHRTLEESREFITTHLARYLKAGDELHRDFLLAINHYARAVAVARRAEIQEAEDTLTALWASFEKANTLTSRSRRKSLQQLDEDWSRYQEKYNFVRAENPVEDINGFAKALTTERAQLKEARRSLSRELQSAGLALSSLTVDSRYGKAEVFETLEGRLNELVSSVDEAGLYQLPIGGSYAATAPRQLQQLESLLDRLRNTRHHLAELDLFYERHHFWYAQPAPLRRLLAPLLDLPTSEWECAFTSWYFERCLEREEYPGRHHYEVTALAAGFTAWENDDLAGEFASIAAAANRLHPLRDDDDWPAKPAPGDLLLSLTGKDDLPNTGLCHELRLAPLQEKDARHYAVAGLREPTLLFTQAFLPLAPPRWRVRAVDSAPMISQKDRILIQPAGAGWRPLADRQETVTTTLNCYFPAGLSAREGEVLLGNWEWLVSEVKEIVFYHGWSPGAITQALLSDGFNADFLCAALLRAAEAAETEPFHPADLVAIGREVRGRCGLPFPAPHPLAKELGRLLRDRLPGYFFEEHLPWRDTFLPLVVTAPGGKKTVLLPDGRLPGYADNLSEARRQAELNKAGFGLIGLPAGRIWANAGLVLEETARALGVANPAL